MKLATVEYEKTQQTALVTGSGEQLLLLERAHHDVTGKPAPELETMQTIIEGGPAARETLDRLADEPPASAIVDAGDVRWMSPLPQPVQIRDFGCFMDHFRNARARIQGVALEDVELPKIQLERPLYYIANRLAVTGHKSDVVWPEYSSLRDYELEFACVLGARWNRQLTRGCPCAYLRLHHLQRFQRPRYSARGDLHRTRSQ